VSERTIHPPRVAIVGPGTVGATTAYALLLSGAAAEIVLIGRDRARAEAQASDLAHAELFSRTARVWAGDYSDCRDAAVTVIAAGVSQRPQMTSRLDDLDDAAAILREIVPRIVENNPHGIIVVATNPVDVLTYATCKWSGLPPERVLGTGTLLDTSRFRALLAQDYHVAPESVHAYVIGEHGDSQVPLLSSANIAGIRLDEFCRAQALEYNTARLRRMADDARSAGLHIVRAKGATSFGIGAAIVRIVRAILRNEQSALTVSCVAPPSAGLGEIALSLPAIVGIGGIHRVLPLSLAHDEAEALRRSADVLKQAAARLIFRH
jgi:L-lactate dehydrogenase